MVAAFTGVQSAAANNAAITVTTSAGLSDPAAGLPRVFTVRGTADRPGRVYVVSRGPGGADCAPSANSDSGRKVVPFYGASVSGAFSLSATRTWGAPGPVMFCIWITRSEGTIAVPFAQTMSFRPPVGSIGALVNPLTPAVNQAAAITIFGQSEVPARAYAKMRPAGAACAASFDAESGRALLAGDAVDGAFSLEARMAEATAGSYALCLWVAGSGADTSPVAGPVLQRVHVLGPPGPIGRRPPCLVPGVTRGIRIATMKNRIRAANCTVGAVRYLRSRTVPRRGIVRLSSRAGSKLQFGSPIKIYVSTGSAKKR